MRVCLRSLFRKERMPVCKAFTGRLVCAMRIKRQVVLSGIIFVFAFMFVFMFVFAPGLRADEVAMQNGDRYFGKVVSVSPKSVTLDSENLGKISVPREKVVSLSFGTNVETNA